MLKSLGLFASVPCPSLPDCPRHGVCLFSHHPPPPTPASASSSSTSLQAQEKHSHIPVRPPGHASPSSNPSSSVGAKRKQASTPGSGNIPSSPATSRPTSSAGTPSSPSSSSSPSAVQNTQVKRSKLDHTSLSQSPSTASPHSPPSKTSTAVLLARPDTVIRPKHHLSTSVSPASPSSSASSSSKPKAKGPPVLKIDLRSHSKPQLRQKVVTQLYEAFCQIYASLKDGDSLACEHAIAQESDIHKKTTQGTYKSLAAVTLQRLKKRPPATSPEDVGIEGEWTPMNETLPSAEVWELAKGYCQTKQQLQEYGYPVELPEILNPVPDPNGICDRCGNSYTIKDYLEEADQTACLYHPLRPRMSRAFGDKIRIYRCCNEPVGSKGCTNGAHVYKEDDLSLLHTRVPFVETPDRSTPAPHRVVAMDCEMCYTSGGFELARLSVVGEDGQVILDELVKPKHPVIDLNTRFSGIKSLEDAKFTLEGVREKLFELIDSNTIIIGQSLENDFKVLRLIHNTVIDTCMMFPHPKGGGIKYSLQVLAQTHLQRFIQDTEDGHDSFEDAKTCLDLVKFKIEKDRHQKS